MGGWLKREILVGRRRIAVREKGDSEHPTVVLLHGLGANQRSWDRVAKHLVDLHVVTFDYSGHGRSDPSGSYSIDAISNDLTAIVSEVADESGYVLAGHSIGADLALVHSSRDPFCRGIVLVDGALTVSPPETDWERLSLMENRSIFKVMTSIGRAFGVVPSMTASEIKTLTDDVEARRHGLDAYLSTLRIPAMYVIGDQVDKVPDGRVVHERKMSAVREVSTRYGLRIEHVPSGHLVPMRQPKRLAELIGEFVARVWSRLPR